MDFRRSLKKKGIWEHPQFTVNISQKHKDGAYRTLHFELKNLPGVVNAKSQELDISYYHQFDIMLPREYPQNLSQIQIISLSPLFHPRISGVKTKACYTVNGEIDRILIDIIFNVLMRPETIRPPTHFKGADWGLDSRKMQWYIQYGPQQLYDHLKELWGERQRKKSPKVEVLD